MNESISTSTGEMDTSMPGTTAPQKKSFSLSKALIWLGVAALLALLAWGLLKAGETRPEGGASAPEFTVQFFDGYEWGEKEASSLSDFRGNVVVLNFWASWCVECRIEAELLEQTWRRYRDQGVVFLGVAYVDAEAKSLAYLNEYNITYPNGPDLGSSISGAYKITGVPETFFIGKDGTVSRYVLGPVNANVLTAEIETLLAQ
ncbi:MAG: TlpA disulfide reductase family protein [Anaerolineae bacterium]|nr:TlpA disulfide reductase family protein [Anaerolineae bacterium]